MLDIGGTAQGPVMDMVIIAMFIIVAFIIVMSARNSKEGQMICWYCKAEKAVTKNGTCAECHSDQMYAMEVAYCEEKLQEEMDEASFWCPTCHVTTTGEWAYNMGCSDCHVRHESYANFTGITCGAEVEADCICDEGVSEKYDID